MGPFGTISSSNVHPLKNHSYLPLAAKVLTAFVFAQGEVTTLHRITGGAKVSRRVEHVPRKVQIAEESRYQSEISWLYMRFVGIANADVRLTVMRTIGGDQVSAARFRVSVGVDEIETQCKMPCDVTVIDKGRTSCISGNVPCPLADLQM
jgi:hypothetical protein